MADWSNLKSSVASVIRTNENNEITGQALQDVLNSIISNLGANAQFAGIATPETTPGTPDGDVFYLAGKAGNYSNFSQIKLDNGEVASLIWNGSSWTKETIARPYVNDLTTGGADKALSAEMGKELNIRTGGTYNSFFVSAYIKDWSGVDCKLFIDLIYRNNIISGTQPTSGVRVRYEIGGVVSTAYYWQSMPDTKAGIETLVGELENNMGTIYLTINWDAFDNATTKVLGDDYITIPLSARANSSELKVFASEVEGKFEDMNNSITEITEDVKEAVDSIGAMVSVTQEVTVKIPVNASYEKAEMPQVLPAGTIIKSYSYKGGTFYFYNTLGKLIKPVVNSVPYTLVEDAAYVGGGIAGDITYSYDTKEDVYNSYIRRKVYIYPTDSQVEILTKMIDAIEDGNCDVHFYFGTYIFDSVYIHMRDVLGDSKGFKGNHFGLPIGNGCRYYLNGSTIISMAPQEDYTNVRNIFDTMLVLGDLEMYDGILINEGGTYCIHDEHGSSETPYIHKYYNIIAKYVVVGDSVAGPKPFGCGTGYNATLCYDTCVFLSDSNADTVFAIHGPTNNTTNKIVTLNMYVKNCFFERYSIQANPSTIKADRDDTRIVYCGCKHKYDPYFTDSFREIVDFNNSKIS